MDVYGIRPAGNIGASGSRLRTNNMGDNPMREPTEPLTEASDVTLTLLNKLMNDKGILDTAIAVGDFEITDDEIMEILGEIGYNEETASIGLFYDLVAELADRMFIEMNEAVETKPTDRFSYMLDAFGNITIYDADNGISVYIDGSEAVEIADKIEAIDDEDELQEYLGSFENLMEGYKTTEQLVESALSNILKGI